MGDKELRDEFIMAALTGLLADPDHSGNYAALAAEACAYADAAMVARKAKP